MMHFFKKDKKQDNKKQLITIQVPSGSDLKKMEGLMAGNYKTYNDEGFAIAQNLDQAQRLSEIVTIINKEFHHIINTSNTFLSKEWLKLFDAIKQQQTKQVRSLLTEMKKDTLLNILYSVHSEEYVFNLIKNCIDAQNNDERKIKYPNIIITPDTFEILIRDLATTLANLNPFYFSFGLPTHHAEKEKWQGFCIFNKIAILIKYAEEFKTKPLKHIVLGTDVHRDNGLSSILLQQGDTDIWHFDCYDSRCYYQELDPLTIPQNVILEQVQGNIKNQEEIKHWRNNRAHYFEINLSVLSRTPAHKIHPALSFTLINLEKAIAEAKNKGAEVLIYLPSGWDSHVDETAICAIMSVNTAKKIRHELKPEEFYPARFDDNDMEYFYQQLFDLCHENADVIKCLYWGLEGGYNPELCEKQTRLLMRSIYKAPQSTWRHSKDAMLGLTV